MASLKIVAVHKDMFGRDIKTGDTVAYTNGALLMVGTVGIMHPKMIRVHGINAPSYRNGSLKHPHETIIVDGPEVTMYLLKLSR